MKKLFIIVLLLLFWGCDEYTFAPTNLITYDMVNMDQERSVVTINVGVINDIKKYNIRNDSEPIRGQHTVPEIHSNRPTNWVPISVVVQSVDGKTLQAVSTKFRHGYIALIKWIGGPKNILKITEK
ncbi:MAG: hypothetical protein V1712_03640 [Patescibacteria group bacterium]